jgi:outer membrane protein TolC
VWNQRDQVEDAVRRVKIADQDLLPTANLVGGYVPRAAASNQQNLKVDGRRRDVSMRLDVDLNLNQKPVRNALRAAQIAEQRARRELDLVEERVRGGIRTAWRELDLARKQYNIALEGMQIAEERVALESDLFQEGRGTARDKVEALRDLNDARNAVIASRITHTLARLRLWRDMGVLFIKKEGDWVNVLSKETPKGS